MIYKAESGVTSVTQHTLMTFVSRHNIDTILVWENPTWDPEDPRYISCHNQLLAVTSKSRVPVVKYEERKLCYLQGYRTPDAGQ